MFPDRTSRARASLFLRDFSAPGPGRRPTAVGLSVLALALLATGCAGIAPAPSPSTTPARTTTYAPPELESLRGGLRHVEDSLVLDLLLGYRQQTMGVSDPDVERRARAAEQQLAYMLRHGGVKERGGEGQPIRPGDGDPLTLRDAVDQMSRALLRNAPGTAWRPQTERAREIQRHRPVLSALIEDAEWVLTLAAALDSPLPDADKRRLRELHEAYASGAPHTDVTERARELLSTVQDERLRREIKKLANRSWERERRARAEAAAPATSPPAPSPRTAPEPVPPPTTSLPPTAPSLSGSPPAAAPPIPAPDTVPDAALDAAPDALTSPDRYCAARRAEAAQSFAAARGTADATEKARLLQQSLASLDDCLERHPGSPEAEKARQNRARVDQELSR